MTAERWLDVIPPDQDDYGPWNTAFGLVGRFVPDCKDCCTPMTDGDLCDSCGEICAHIALGIQEARDERRERGMRGPGRIWIVEMEEPGEGRWWPLETTATTWRKHAIAAAKVYRESDGDRHEYRAIQYERVEPPKRKKAGR